MRRQALILYVFVLSTSVQNLSRSNAVATYVPVTETRRANGWDVALMPNSLSACFWCGTCTRKWTFNSLKFEYIWHECAWGRGWYCKPRNEQSQRRDAARYMNCRRGSHHPAVSRNAHVACDVRVPANCSKRNARRRRSSRTTSGGLHTPLLGRQSTAAYKARQPRGSYAGNGVPRPLLVGMYALLRPKEIHGHCPSERETEGQVSQDQNRMRLRYEQRPGMSKAKHAHRDFE